MIDRVTTIHYNVSYTQKLFKRWNTKWAKMNIKKCWIFAVEVHR